MRHRFPATRVAAIVVMLLGACEGPFARENPYDPESILELELTGTRTTSSWAADTLEFEFSVEPATPPFPVQWSVVPSGMDHIGGGRFVTRPAGLTVRNVWVRAGWATRRDSVLVQLQQLPESLSITCGASPTCTTFTAIGEVRAVGPVLWDVNDQLVQLASTDPSSLVSRDPAIVSVLGAGSLVSAGSVRAEAEGSTWVVGSIAGKLDSLFFTVDLP